MERSRKPGTITTKERGSTLEAHPTDLPYAPNWTASADTTYRFLTQFKLNVDCQYVDHQNALSRGRNFNAVNASRIDSYFLLNAKLSYDFKLPFWDRGGQIFLAGQNLTDADYQQVPGYPMPGINGMVASSSGSEEGRTKVSRCALSGVSGPDVIVTGNQFVSSSTFRFGFKCGNTRGETMHFSI